MEGLERVAGGKPRSGAAPGKAEKMSEPRQGRQTLIKYHSIPTAKLLCSCGRCFWVSSSSAWLVYLEPFGVLEVINRYPDDAVPARDSPARGKSRSK